MSPRITACLIVKNEAMRLPRCLASLTEAVDEIVLVDTGSNDDTPRIAQNFGARVSTFAWSNDFSAARNFAIEQARGDWILTIDADEWLKPGSIRPLRAALSLPDAIAYKIQLVNHLDGDHSDRELLTRLFRNCPEIRYRGRIHEQVSEAVAALTLKRGSSWLPLEEVVIEHDGYLKAIVKERDKSQRNLVLLEMAVREAPNDAYLRYKYALELGNERGQSHLEVALSLLLEMTPAQLMSAPWAEQAFINGALFLCQLGRPAIVSQITERSRLAFGEHPVLKLARARAELLLGNPRGALRFVDQAETSPARGPTFDPAGFQLELSLTAAAAHKALGQLDAAKSRLEAATRAQPAAAAPVHQLISLAIETNDLGFAIRLGLRRLKEHPEDGVTLALCATVAERTGDRAIAQRWRQAALALGTG